LLTWYPKLFFAALILKRRKLGFAVMVQLFNVPDITNKLIEDHNLLECFTTVFCDVISRCTKGDHSIVDVEHAAIERKVGTWL
jgi:hypothetical protein